MGIITQVLIGLGLLYVFIAAFSILCFACDKPFSGIWYYITSYSFGLLFSLRFLTLISVNNNAINLYGINIPVTKSIAKTQVFDVFKTICSSDNETIMLLFLINIVLYISTLFILKMTTRMNTFKLRNVFYCFLLLILTSRTVKVGVSFEVYFTLLIFALVLYLIAAFGKNMLSNFRNTIKDSVDNYKRRPKGKNADTKRALKTTNDNLNKENANKNDNNSVKEIEYGEKGYSNN